MNEASPLSMVCVPAQFWLAQWFAWLFASLFVCVVVCVTQANVPVRLIWFAWLFASWFAWLFASEVEYTH